jgi:hypothetical protein
LASITETAGNLAGKAVRGATKVAVGTAKWAGGELLSATLPGLPGFARSIHSTYTALTPSMPDGSAVGSGTSPNLRAGHHTTDTLSAQRMESLRLQVGQLVDQERQVGDRLLARLNILGEIRDAVPMLAAAGQPSATPHRTSTHGRSSQRRPAGWHAPRGSGSGAPRVRRCSRSRSPPDPALRIPGPTSRKRGSSRPTR